VTVPIKTLRPCGNPTFAELLPRLRCQKCRGKPAPVYLCASPHRVFYGGPNPDWAIELMPARPLPAPRPLPTMVEASPAQPDQRPKPA